MATPATLTSSAPQTKRIWKLQEFVAHSSNVNCLALGHVSGRVMATGGDDKKVNLWAVGKTSCILSLSGHSTPVECVRFGHTEDLVCAGSQAGALKIWDLEQAKIVRTLTGHKANIRCVDFHPYGDFLCSGSQDTNIKLWDIRRKGCIFTYKGHSHTINSLKFSPDGQWIASAGQDGLVKLWDLRQGRSLHKFSEHKGPVVDVQFHPHEFLLASGSSDCTVSLWDLENFQLVSSCGGDCSAIRCISFSAGGECVFSASQDVLRVYGWEPAQTFDSIPVIWGKIQDMATSQNQLITASFQNSSVTLYVVELSRIQPFSPATKKESSPFRYGQTARKSFIKEKLPNGTKPVVNMKVVEESDRSGTDPEDESIQVAEIKDVVDYQSIFHPQRDLARTPPPENEPFPAPPEDDPLAPQIMSDSFLAPPEDSSESNSISPETCRRPSVSHPPRLKVAPLVDGNMRRQNSLSESKDASSPTNLTPQLSKQLQPRAETSRRDVGGGSIYDSAYFSDAECVVRSNHLRHSPSEPSLNKVDLSHPRSSSLTRENATSSPRSDLTTLSRPMDKPAIVRPPPKSEYPIANKSVENTDKSDKSDDYDYVPMIIDKPSGLDLDEFLPKKFQMSAGRGYQQTTELSEAEVFSSILRGHDSMMAVLLTRNRNLQIIHKLWMTKDVKAAVESAVGMNDLAVLVDLISVLIMRPSIWNLDLCVGLLPPIYDLLQNKYESYMTVGCNALRLILRNFVSVIKTNIESPIRTVGVDISREERYNKCMACYNHLMSIRAFILKRQTLQGKLGHAFRELHILMQALD